MAISNLTGFGKMENTQQGNKLYLINITAHSVAAGDTDFNFYASSPISNFTELSNYFRTHGIHENNYYRIYCFGCRVNSSYVPIISMWLETANFNTIVAHGYLTNGTAYDVQITSSYASGYFNYTEV